MGSAHTPKNVSDYSAYACGCAAERLHGGGVIVSFHFCSYAIAFVEADYARVVFKNADAPWRLNFFGGFGYVGFEEAVDFFAVEFWFCLWMFCGSSVRSRFGRWFAVPRRSGYVFLFEVGLDCLHFLQA